jgi:hypothetical protein
MATTNKYKLPEPLFNALSFNRYPPVVGRLAATALIDAPLQRVLLMKHSSEIVEDASERLWALLGSAVHYVIEKGGDKKTVELKKTCTHKSGATLVCKGDYYKDLMLYDWKFTSVWQYMLDGKKNWTKQLNVNRYIYKQNNCDVDSLFVYAILRDWSRSKSYEHDYPNIPFQEVPLKIWDDSFLDTYIDSRVQLHLEAEKNINNLALIPRCTPEEMMEKPTTYAVKRENIVKAVRVFYSELEADEYIKNANPKSKNKDKLYIELRAGEKTKCLNYCSVSEFCPYYQSDMKKPNVGQ